MVVEHGRSHLYDLFSPCKLVDSWKKKSKQIFNIFKDYVDLKPLNFTVQITLTEMYPVY